MGMTIFRMIPPNVLPKRLLVIRLFVLSANRTCTHACIHSLVNFLAKCGVWLCCRAFFSFVVRPPWMLYSEELIFCPQAFQEEMLFLSHFYFILY